MPVAPALFLILMTHGVLSSETVSPSPPPASNMVLETWEIALIAGCGTLALLMCAYSVYILMRRRGRTPTRVVDIENAPQKKDEVPKKNEGPNTRETSAVAVKKQVDNSAVECPGGAKKCMGARKEGVETVQPNNYRPKRDAPSRIGGSKNRRHVGDSRI